MDAIDYYADLHRFLGFMVATPQTVKIHVTPILRHRFISATLQLIEDFFIRIQMASVQCYLIAINFKRYFFKISEFQQSISHFVHNTSSNHIGQKKMLMTYVKQAARVTCVSSLYLNLSVFLKFQTQYCCINSRFEYQSIL